MFSTLLFCNVASAEWILVGGTHKYDGYVDVATVGPTGKTVTLWTLKDFKVDRQIPQGTYRSVRIKKQIDCLAHKSRPCRPSTMRHKWARVVLCSRGKEPGNGRG
jgi:hypothetical protein